jgi:MoxR-like ATPase
MTARDTILDLKARMGRSIIGQEQVQERILIGLLANGNLLVERLEVVRRRESRPAQPRSELLGPLNPLAIAWIRGRRRS